MDTAWSRTHTQQTRLLPCGLLHNDECTIIKLGMGVMPRFRMNEKTSLINWDLNGTTRSGKGLFKEGKTTSSLRVVNPKSEERIPRVSAIDITLVKLL